jgi:hypothetical protein
MVVHVVHAVHGWFERIRRDERSSLLGSAFGSRTLPMELPLEPHTSCTSCTTAAAVGQLELATAHQPSTDYLPFRRGLRFALGPCLSCAVIRLSSATSLFGRVVYILSGLPNFRATFARLTPSPGTSLLRSLHRPNRGPVHPETVR